MDLESGSSRYQLSPPQGPSFSSSAAQRYNPIPTSHSMPYLDAPINGLPSSVQPQPRSSRPLPSTSSTNRHLPTSSVSNMPRSASLLFPANNRNGSVEPSVPMQRSERWMERYTRRDDQSPAPEVDSRLAPYGTSPGPLGRSSTSRHLSSVPPHLRPLPRSASVVSLDNSRRSMSVTDEPDRKRSKSRGQMVWQPEEGFLSKITVEQRAVPSPLPTSNAAERILLALESMRSPLLDARRHHPTLPSSLPRSSSLSKIHVPSAAAREKEKEDRKRDVMISPYGRGRDKKEKERSDVKGSGLRQALGRKEMEEDEVEPSPVKRGSGGPKGKGKGKGKERERRSERRGSEMDEDEEETPKRRHSSKKRYDRDDDARMSESQSEFSPAPPSPPKRAIPTAPTDDSAFQPLAPVASNDPTSRARSALRARSSTSRKHVSAVNSRSGTPGPLRMSAREEDLPAEEDDDLGALDKIKFVLPGAPASTNEGIKSASNGTSSLLSRMDSAPAPSSAPAASSFFAAPSASTSAAPPPKVPSPNPFAAPPAPAVATASRTPSAAFSFTTTTPTPPIVAPVPTVASSGVPNFFGSKAEAATPVAPLPKKSFSLGIGHPTNGSTTPSGPPPSKPSVPNFFGNAAAAPSRIPTPPSGGTFLFGKPPTPVPSAPTPPPPAASNPFAGVGIAKDAAPAAPAPSTSAAVETKATPSPFGGFGSFGSSSSTEAPKSNLSFSTAATTPPATAPAPIPAAPASNPFSFGQAAKPAAAPSSFGNGFGAPTSTPSFSFGGEKKEPSPAPVVAAPAASPSPFSFSAPASKEPTPTPTASSSLAPSSNPFGSQPAAASTGFSFGKPAASTPAPAATSSPFTFGSTPASAAVSNGTKDDSSMMESSPDRTSSFAFGSTAPSGSAPPNLFGGASSSVTAPKPAAPAFGGGGGMFGSSTSASSSPFGAPAPSTSPAPFTFGQPAAAAPASGGFGTSSSTSGFGQSTPTAPSFGQSASSGFSFGGAAASPAAASPSTFSFGASSAAPAAPAPSSFNFSSPPPQSGFGGVTSPGLSSNPNPFGSSAPTPAFGGGASAAPSTFSFGGGAPVGGGSSFTFGAGSTGGSVSGTPPPPSFGSPGPQSPVAGTGTLFNMGAADSAPSPGRVAIYSPVLLDAFFNVSLPLFVPLFDVIRIPLSLSPLGKLKVEGRSVDHLIMYKSTLASATSIKNGGRTSSTVSPPFITSTRRSKRSTISLLFQPIFHFLNLCLLAMISYLLRYFPHSSVSLHFSQGRGAAPRLLFLSTNSFSLIVAHLSCFPPPRHL
ncbi:hypothetical protein BDY24DRAFT_370012 [Mrakia frigida]|uniref:uncharacterized protein n=1 Tax=Mrakia frigida TaxID=29902 RepID=UPI003FCC00E0